MLLSGESPILNTVANFNWDKDIPLLSKKHEVFKNIDQNKKGYIFSENEKSSIQKKLKENNLIISPITTKDEPLGYMLLCNKETRKE